MRAYINSSYWKSEFKIRYFRIRFLFNRTGVFCRNSQRSTKGVVFAHPEQLKKLERHGWLTLMDSTHKTNRYDWCLFTLYVRDTYGCWNVGAHFFVSNEDADTVAQALTIIRNMCCRWSPRYVLSNHSNIEPKSIKKIFSSISAGEQECEILLCVVHVIRTWIQKIHEKNSGHNGCGDAQTDEDWMRGPCSGCY